jgi:biopolymer transport protein ExbD
MKRAAKLPDIELSEPPITPFIDVVFQLLIFFMLTLQFSDVVVERLQLPDAKDLKTRKTDPDLLIINIARDGTVKVGGRTFFDPARSLPAPQEYSKIEEMFNARRFSGKYSKTPGAPVDYYILIRADRSTDFEHVQRLLMAATSYGGVTKVMFAAAKERS